MKDTDMKFITVKELAELLQIGRNTAYELVNNKPDFPVIRLRGRLIIPVAALETWISENTGKQILF